MNAVHAFEPAPIEPIEVAPEITAEIVIELIAVVCAKLEEIRSSSASESFKDKADKLYGEMHDRRLAFNPHDKGEVEAMLKTVSSIADDVEAGRLP